MLLKAILLDAAAECRDFLLDAQGSRLQAMLLEDDARDSRL